VRAVLAVLVVISAVQTAEAGRTQYGWLYGSEVLPEGGVEVQTWVYEKNGRGDDPTKTRETLFWWGALVGVTDQFELVFPVEFFWQKIDGAANASFTIEKFGIEARYRFTKTDLENPDGVAPLFRVSAKRDVTVRDVTILEADLVTSYQSGPFHGLIDLGMVARLSENDAQLDLRPGAGVAIEVKKDLRFGAEGYGEIFLDDDLKKFSWLGVGPNVAWTKGRFWLSASFLIGVYQIDTAPRVLWGILF
jgi:hypothetical protein